MKTSQTPLRKHFHAWPYRSNHSGISSLPLSLSFSLTLFSQFSSLLIALSLTPCNNQHLVLAKQNGQPGQAEPRSPLWCTSAIPPYWTRTRTRTPPPFHLHLLPHDTPVPPVAREAVSLHRSVLTFNAHAKKPGRGTKPEVQQRGQTRYL